jgi:hypothetical protein
MDKHEESAWRHHLNKVLSSLQDVFLSIFRTLRQAILAAANMASRAGSKTMSPDLRPPKRQMVHLKTKEESRLGNETIQVWTVELPSKHAEGILRYLHTLSCIILIADLQT